MIKKTRTILFLVCLFLFLLIAPAVIFYSQGYRFDWENKKIIQTGGLFLKVEPKQVEIYINDELIKKTDFFFGSVLIENLLPKKYKIEVKKEGYHSWEKKLEIGEKKVTEAKNIVLFPKNINFEILLKNIKNFWFSPDEKKIAFSEISENGWALKLYDLEKNLKSQIIEKEDVYLKEADLMALDWSPDSRKIYLDLRIKESEKKFVLDLDRIPAILTEIKIPLNQENIVASQNINNNQYLLDSFGNLFKNGKKLTEESFPVKPETKYELKIWKDVIFLREEKNLYLFNSDLRIFEKFFQPLNSLKISPDFKKLVYFSDYEIWILFLEEREKKMFLTRFSEKIGNIFWLNDNYLIFNIGNPEGKPSASYGASKIKIVEIDDRDRIQIWELGSFKEPEIFWNQKDKKLYLLSEENLYVSEVLIK